MASTTTAPSDRIATSSSSCAKSPMSTGETGRCRRSATSWSGGRRPNEDPGTDRQGAEPRQVHRLPHLLGDLQAGLDHAGGRRVRLVQQRREQAGHRLSEGLGKPESLERRLADEGKRPDTAAHGWQVADSRQHRSEGHTSELQSLMRISYAVFFLKKQNIQADKSYT